MRRSLVDPIPEIFRAAEKLSAAVDAHHNRQFDDAQRLFAEADDPLVWQYADLAWGKGARTRFAFITVPNAPPLLAKADRPYPRMPDRAIRAAIIERDGYHSRFCGIPVVDASIRALIHRAYPNAVKWGRTNAEQHAAFQCMWLQFDHILPNGRGGDSSLENMVVTCAPCNFGRMETTLDEARLIDPRTEFHNDTWTGFSSWDGLNRFRLP